MTPITRRPGRAASRGAALLLAMFTVTLVASLAAAALWQQWRAAEVEAAERQRAQAHWLLAGALDWARLILREDARSGGADHLAEPWAIPLEEARLSTFLASGAAGEAGLDRDAFLSGRILDAQARLNVWNLVEGTTVSEPDRQAFLRLFDVLALPAGQVDTLAGQLLAARQDRPSDGGAAVPLLPERVEQLGRLGLPIATVEALRPYVTVLPQRTTVNLNTAPEPVLQAAVPGLEPADARRLVTERGRSHFRTVADATRLAPAVGAGPSTLVGVSSRFFEVEGALRLDELAVRERSLVQRDGLTVRTLWRVPAP